MNKIHNIYTVGLFALVLAGFGIWLLSGSSFEPRVAGDFAEHTDSEGLYADYINPQYGFSFSYPKPYSLSEFSDGEALTVLLDSPEGPALQIAMSAFDENIPVLTEERIRKDLPKLVMEDVKNISVGFDIAVQFKNPEGTIETWFIHEKTLYQISTKTEHALLLSTVLSSWTF